jgi:hypothetical protein
MPVVNIPLGDVRPMRFSRALTGPKFACISGIEMPTPVYGMPAEAHNPSTSAAVA